MSSDESEPDLAGRRYIRVDPTYRAREVGIWIRVFDRVYLVHRLLCADDQRGRMPRLRERNGSQRPSRNPRQPLQLPINVYRQEWLAGCSAPFIQAVLRPDPVPHNLNIDPVFMEQVVFPSPKTAYLLCDHL